MAPYQEIFEVVGGGAVGGLIVREGKDLNSEKVEERLATGSMIRLLEEVQGRARYELVDGEGPMEGWVAIKVQGKDMLQKADDSEGSTVSTEGTPRGENRARQLRAKCRALAEVAAKDDEEALQGYGQRLGEACKMSVPVPAPAVAPSQTTAPAPLPLRSSQTTAPAPAAALVPGFARQSFAWSPSTQQKPKGEQALRWGEARKEMEEALGVTPGSLDASPKEVEAILSQEQAKEGKPQGKQDKQGAGRAGPIGSLECTFGYAGSLCEHPPYALFDVRDEVCMKAGGFRHGQVVREKSGAEFVTVGVKSVDGNARLWFQPRDVSRRAAGAFPGASVAELKARFTLVGPLAKVAKDKKAKHLVEALPEDFDAVEDSDGEEVLLCQQCRLPIGDVAYTKGDDTECRVHAACWSKFLQKDDKGRQNMEAAKKQAKRADHAIGWSVEAIPRSVEPAKKLGCVVSERGMCCLVMQEGNGTRVAPTLEPSAAVNLEYLSLALQVRMREGTEMRFSLDPLDGNYDPRANMQVKRFEPHWLAGTSAGEVLFQADYHLKELSMGEHEQPVAGMKSCFDHSEAEHFQDAGWKAREWFVVRSATVQLSEDNVIMPNVKLGVEAREQVPGPHGLEDAPITRPDHPLVKYAQEFTHNFDLIAERKSVIYHLRELAKASVVAKFLLDSGVGLEEVWYNLAGEERGHCDLEVPQLWNERCDSRVIVKDGKIMNEDKLRAMHGLYGGVSFDLERFAVYWDEKLRGVDLNLDRFDLSEAAGKATAGAALGSLPAQPPMGKAFWSGLDAETAIFKDEERKLLSSIFNPSLSDRREEGEGFVPPCADSAYVRGLRRLLEEESQVRQKRKEAFFSVDFGIEGISGPLFPCHWAASLETQDNRRERMLRPEKATQAVLREVVKATTPIFNEATEDGTRYRIYRFGALEVRSTQEHNGEEVVGVVFSLHPSPAGAQTDRKVNISEQVVKVTEFVEKRPQDTPAAAPLFRRNYVVLETEQGHSIVTEQLGDGAITWAEDPEGLDERLSMAKVIRSTDCGKKAVKVGDVRAFHEEAAANRGNSASRTQRKGYARMAYCKACGEEGQSKSGFRPRLTRKRWLAVGGAAKAEKARRSAPQGEKRVERFADKAEYKALGEAMRFLMGVQPTYSTAMEETSSASHVFDVRIH
mmetsp:Transcript_23963/g.50837  ORF Transcript_23963/g.50837 Transcript_23963/m.50837 type:complete len:1164 (-) Transcript_23963:85-3576(-)